jgi:DNA-binding LytR/AlgR family response regulator
MKDFFIKSGETLTKFELGEVYFFTKKERKVLAVFKDKYVEMNTSLYNISNLLGENSSFIRTHKSFVVNRDKIKSISKYTENTYNIKFVDIQTEAFITKNNLKFIKESSLLF